MNKAGYLKLFAWSLSLIVIILAITAWGQNLQWQLSQLDVYKFFPLLGLLAFSLMWNNYIVSAIRQYIGVDKKAIHSYIEATGWAVLALILFHPGLLEWQLLHDHFGLPPGSVLRYVQPGLKVFAVFGMVSLLLFLSYELRRWYKDKPWWHYISYATDLGMLLIFAHSIKLGHNLQTGWLRDIWLFYGLTLVIAMSYLYKRKFSKSNK